jgi:hypothetical protein
MGYQLWRRKTIVSRSHRMGFSARARQAVFLRRRRHKPFGWRQRLPFELRRFLDVVASYPLLAGVAEVYREILTSDLKNLSGAKPAVPHAIPNVE